MKRKSFAFTGFFALLAFLVGTSSAVAEVAASDVFASVGETTITRAEFEREVLFPLAGLDASRVEEYYAIEDVVSRLNYAGNEAARRYLDKDIDAAAAVQWLQDYSLMSKERAEQRLKFIEKYRAYVINYNLGKDLVRNHVEAVGGNSDARWDVFEKLLSTPISASMLNEN